LSAPSTSQNSPSKFSGLSKWNQARKQKKHEKEEHERQAETPFLKMATFIFTMVAMAAGMSFLPLLPQPVPLLLAAIVGFATYKSPRLGMPFGGLIIGVGLLFHLSELYFISFLGDTAARVIFIVVWLTLFILLPAMFNRYKSALAIDFGILAFVVLFFDSFFFLAIPLILASAVYFKKYVGLTMVYYVLLSVPLQLVQYYNYIVTIKQSDWWTVAGSAPPVFVSLSSIFKDLTLSMDQFRLYDISKVVYDILGQTTWIPDWTGRTIKDAVTQYLDSIPGIMMFVVIVAGLALLLIFFTQFLVKGGIIGSADRFFPIFTATIAAALFFVLLSALQIPLAFTADVTGTTMVLGIFATVLFTLPVMFMEYAPQKRATIQEVVDKAKGLLDNVTLLEGEISNVKDTLPVIVSSPEGKACVLRERIQDIQNFASLHKYEAQELDEKFVELDKLGKDREGIETELNNVLNEYQIFSNCELSNWIGKLKSAGLGIKTEVKVEYKKDMPLEQRIEAIKKILENGKSVVKEVSSVSEPIYAIIRLLYDPTLPLKSFAVVFAAEKIEKKDAPWTAIESLYNALNNWKRQYSAEIQKSFLYLQKSLKPIASLNDMREMLPAVFGENTSKVLDYAKQAESMKALAEKRVEKSEDMLDLQDVVSLRNDIEAFVAMSNDVLSTLYKELVSHEEAIDRLLPTKDYLWEKNISLKERLELANRMLADPSKYKINEVLADLPKYLGYINESVQTLSFYAERREFLLNYPLAEAAINEQLKTKEKLVPSDLPFQPRFAAEYLRLYYTTRYGDYMFDKDNLVLEKRL
jgi:hypothetical protein